MSPSRIAPMRAMQQSGRLSQIGWAVRIQHGERDREDKHERNEQFVDRL